MLHAFLSTNRLDIIGRCMIKALRRPGRAPLPPGFRHGVPQFLDQVIETLRLEQTVERERGIELSGASGGLDLSNSEVGESAALHGRELLASGFTVDEVVHDYGDLCQAITELALEREFEITVDEFHTLNRCLDNAIADAVREYSYGKQVQVEGVANAYKIRHAFFVHELRNMLNTARLAFAAIRGGKVTAGGATGDVMLRALQGLSTLVEHSVSELRGEHDTGSMRKLVPLSEFIADAFRAATLAAEARGCTLVVATVDPSLAIEVDRDLVFAALSNLLTNAFKFTVYGSEVSLAAFATGERILITVSDQCGGVPPQAAARLFTPYVQVGTERSGLGLGLAIVRSHVEASLGTVAFRNVEGKGCVFTISLPRHELAEIVPA